MDHFLRQFRSRGHKMTPQRRAVIRALHEGGKFASAQEILEYARKTTPDISLDTVYRNLMLLVELGLVNHVNFRGRGGSAFEIAADGHHHHLVCLGCGNAYCVDYCPVAGHDVARAEALGFEIVSHALEFYGYCRACRQAT